MINATINPNTIQGYNPIPNNFGKPLFLDREGSRGLEGLAAKDKLADLYRQARAEGYDLLGAFYEKKYREEEEPQEMDDDELFEQMFGRYNVLNTLYNLLQRRLPVDKPNNTYGNNKQAYKAIQNHLKQQQGRSAGEGAIIFSNGEQYGSRKDLAGADRLAQRYEAFVNSSVGKQLFKDLGGAPKFDGYAFMNLGQGVLGAMIDVGDKKVLAINKQYAAQLEGTALETYVLAHESVHGLGERSEYNTDNKLYNSFSKAAGRTSGPERRTYASLANIGRQYTKTPAA
ncbi:MAG: hypothetical protein KAT43_04880 [Nanoarchaeota archaeon]|nr:hypothetical protein [Nanoarchaeota archaeon]